jgi:16S rRNA (cytidine1402-2'-O)-methyltransferase
MSKLIVIPTPIGNLEDITLRAIRALKEVDEILCEDTRVTSKLMNHLEISKKLNSFHQHNEHKLLDRIVDKMASGSTLGLVSDAGTPGISDPGFLLIRECLKQGIEVECLPGPVAFIPAIVKSGIPCDRFLFEGFLPMKKGRQTKVKEIAESEKTVVIYESPHKLLKTLEQLNEFCEEDRQISVSRELTKKFEETVNGTVVEVLKHFTENTVKGEFVIIISGKK